MSKTETALVKTPYAKNLQLLLGAKDPEQNLGIF
jgi:hypothetical protein